MSELSSQKTNVGEWVGFSNRRWTPSVTNL